MKSLLWAALTSLLLALAFSCVTADEPAVDTLDPSVDQETGDEAELDVVGEQCGSVVCTGKTHCCNASCGRCAPIGVECPQVACVLDEEAAEESGADEVEAASQKGDVIFEVGQQCGHVFCTGTTPKCCNAACGICVPFGAQCTQEHTC